MTGALRELLYLYILSVEIIILSDDRLTNCLQYVQFVHVYMQSIKTRPLPEMHTSQARNDKQQCLGGILF